MRYTLPEVSAIVLNYNCANDTISCVENLLKTRYQNLSVIVVDNASETEDISKLDTLRHKILEIIYNNTNLGYAGGNNIGINYAMKNTNSDYILIINPDVIVDTEFLIELISIMEKYSKVGISAPIQCYWDKPQVVYTVGGRLWWFLGQHQMLGNGLPLKSIPKQLLKVDFVSGACILIRRQLLEKKLLPEEYFLQWEDIDYCTYTRRLGYNIVVVPTSIVLHKIGLTVQAGNRVYEMIYRGIRNRFRFFFKYIDSVILRIAWLFIFSFVTFPIYLMHAIIIRKDLRRAKAVLLGFKEGSIQTITECLRERSS
ncbi:MAG: glycosyltransferase family 2 protein [Candidatus Hodarchaeota archaeon]